MIMITPQHTKKDTQAWITVWDDIVRIAMGQ
jgi:hypothetical protein